MDERVVIAASAADIFSLDEFVEEVLPVDDSDNLGGLIADLGLSSVGRVCTRQSR